MSSAETIIDRAVRDHAAANMNFFEYLDFWLSSPGCYMNTGPRHMLMVIHNEEINGWHVHYALNLTEKEPLALFLPMMPYPLPCVTWFRPLKGGHAGFRRLFRTADLFRAARLPVPDNAGLSQSPA